MDVSYGTSAIQESREFVKHGVWGYDVFGAYRMTVEHVYYK